MNTQGRLSTPLFCHVLFICITMTESWETSKMLLCTIQQHRAPRTRFTVAVNNEHKAFNTFAELKHWLLTTQR